MASDKRLIKELLITGKKIERCGLVIGEGGNISARRGKAAYIKRRGVSMATAKAADYVPVDINTGKPLDPKTKPSTEDIGAVIHTHPVFITALGISRIGFKSLSYEARVYLKSDIAAIPYVKPGSRALGRAVGRVIKKHNAVILKNHGLITVGKDIREAFLRTLAAERAALIYVSSKIVRKL
jgi:L-fuculose-phosphate aldolase